MKFIKQFLLILTMTFLGEIFHMLIPLPIPASIYGLVLMLAALLMGIIKVEQVKETGAFLIEIMPMMFIPAGVGLLNSWGSLKVILVPVFVVTVVSTVAVMAVSGRITQFMIRREKKR